MSSYLASFGRYASLSALWLTPIGRVLDAVNHTILTDSLVGSVCMLHRLQESSINYNTNYRINNALFEAKREILEDEEKSKLDLLASKHFPAVFEKEKGLRKDILLYPELNQKDPTRIPNMPAGAMGANSFGSACVLIDPSLIQADMQAARAICLHEFSHINTSDPFIANAMAVITSAVSIRSLSFFQSRLPGWASLVPYSFPFIASALTLTGVMRIFEGRADDFMIRYASDEELKGFERYLVAAIEVYKELHEKYPYSATSSGNNRWDWSHPLMTSRLEKTQNELRKRNIPPQDLSNEVLTKLMEYVRGIVKENLEMENKARKAIGLQPITE